MEFFHIKFHSPWLLKYAYEYQTKRQTGMLEDALKYLKYQCKLDLQITGQSKTTSENICGFVLMIPDCQ